jgi:hypothetical protein
MKMTRLSGETIIFLDEKESNELVNDLINHVGEKHNPKTAIEILTNRLSNLILDGDR